MRRFFSSSLLLLLLLLTLRWHRRRRRRHYCLFAMHVKYEENTQTKYPILQENGTGLGSIAER